MKPGISCLVMPKEWDYSRILQETKDAGYEALELVVRDEEGPLPLNASTAQLRELAGMALDTGLEIASICPALSQTPQDLMTSDVAVRRPSVDTIKRLLEIAESLGTDTILLVLGSLTPDLYYDEAYSNALEEMQKLAPQAEAAQVNLAIEYVWNKFLLSPLEFNRFCDEVGNKWVGFYFDPGNMTIFGYAEHWARICGRHIRKMHIKDYRCKDNSWPALGEGDVNFPAVMTELRAAGYDGALISEVSMQSATLKSTASAIQKIMAL